MVAVSLFTKPPTDEQVKGLTYHSITAEQRTEIKASIDKWDIIHTVILIGMTAAIYTVFW